jgi:outer membrane autotransporter protein
VVVNYLDLNRIGDVVEANLDEFGLISAGACPVSCATDPNQFSRYLFYLDRVHLSSAGFAIVGRYAVRQLEAPQTFEAQSDLGLSAAHGFGQLMSGRLDLGGGGDQRLAFFLVGTAASHDFTRSNTSFAYDYDSFGVAAGAEIDIGPGLVGGAVSYSKPKTDFTNAVGRTRADAWHVGAYGQIEFAGAFVEGYAGYGWLDYDFRREAVIDQISAETDGTSLVAGGEAGFLFGILGVSAGPVIGIQYARAELDGYTEAGDPVLTLNVSEQRASETLGFAGVEAQIDSGVGPLAIQPYVKLLAEKQLDGNARTISYSNTASPTIVNSFDRTEESDDVYGRVEGGLSIGLGSAISLQAQASATLEHPHGDEVSGFLGVKLGF